MDMSKHPEQAAHARPAPMPGEPHDRDLSNPGEIWGFVLALGLVAALGTGFAVAGLAGLGAVMVALVPVIYLVLILISVGR